MNTVSSCKDRFFFSLRLIQLDSIWHRGSQEPGACDENWFPLRIHLDVDQNRIENVFISSRPMWCDLTKVLSLVSSPIPPHLVNSGSANMFFVDFFTCVFCQPWCSIINSCSHAISEHCWPEVVSLRGPIDKAMMSASQCTAPSLQMLSFLTDSRGECICICSFMYFQ